MELQDISAVTVTASVVHPLICEEPLLHLLIRPQFLCQLPGDSVFLSFTPTDTSPFLANHKDFIPPSPLYIKALLPHLGFLFFLSTIHPNLIPLLLVFLVYLCIFLPIYAYVSVL